MQGLEDHIVAIGKHEKFHMPRRCRQRIDPLRHLRQRLPAHPLLQMIGRQHGDPDRGCHPQQAERKPLRLKQRRLTVRTALHQRSVGQHQPIAQRLRRKTAQCRARSVRAGRRRPGQRLRIDIALVDQRKPFRPKRRRQPVQPPSGRHPRALPIGGNVQPALHIAQRNQGSSRLAQWHEAVPRPHHPQLCRIRHASRKRLQRARPQQCRRACHHAARPVPPLCHPHLSPGPFSRRKA